MHCGIGMIFYKAIVEANADNIVIIVTVLVTDNFAVTTKDNLVSD